MEMEISCLLFIFFPFFLENLGFFIGRRNYKADEKITFHTRVFHLCIFKYWSSKESWNTSGEDSSSISMGIKENILFDFCRKRSGSWDHDFAVETRIRTLGEKRNSWLGWNSDSWQQELLSLWNLIAVNSSSLWLSPMNRVLLPDKEFILLNSAWTPKRWRSKCFPADMNSKCQGKLNHGSLNKISWVLESGSGCCWRSNHS